jgi:methylated-DNA-protein-cysteine methyltransferase related protein
MTTSSRVLSPGFHSRVFSLVRQIPKGKVSTYGRIAAMLGHPGVARHVGNALAACGSEDFPVPWHRVVNASGKISTGGSEQHTLLLREGVRFGASGAIPLAEFLWTPGEPRRAARTKVSRSRS